MERLFHTVKGQKCPHQKLNVEKSWCPVDIVHFLGAT